MDNYNNLKTEYIDIKDRFLESKTDITVLGKIKNDTEINYGLNIYAYNYHVSQPIKELNFNGSIIFGAMNFPKYGVIGIKDKINKTIKLYMLSFYSGNEYPHALTDEIDFKSLKKLIIYR